MESSEGINTEIHNYSWRFLVINRTRKQNSDENWTQSWFH
jgi:hypothetical protein